MSIELHPEFLSKNGKKEFVILPYEEYELLQEALEDLEDLKLLRAAKAESMNEKNISIDEVKKDLGF